MNINITNTELIHFIPPKFSFGQKVRTTDQAEGYLVGLDFYPENRLWSCGVHLVDKNNQLSQEVWYEAEEVEELNSVFSFSHRGSNITNPKLFQLNQPRFSFGQRVRTKNNLNGYIVGLDFCLETKTWSYGVYLTNRNHKFIEEIWYEAEELEAPIAIFEALPAIPELLALKVQVSFYPIWQDSYEY